MGIFGDFWGVYRDLLGGFVFWVEFVMIFSDVFWRIKLILVGLMKVEWIVFNMYKIE
jgi:hypothetical protein